MMRSAIRSLLLAVSLLASGLVWAQPTVILVRHGEKLDSSRDSVLSPAGEARALRLAQMLAASGIRAIYTTEYRRTILLAAPLAKQLGVTPVAVPGADQDAFGVQRRAHGVSRLNGLSGRIRTCDPLIPRQVRWSATLHPDRRRRAIRWTRCVDGRRDGMARLRGDPGGKAPSGGPGPQMKTCLAGCTAKAASVAVREERTRGNRGGGERCS